MTQGTVVHNEPDDCIVAQAQAACPLVDHYDFLGTVVAVRANAASLLDDIRRVFDGFQTRAADQLEEEYPSFYLCHDGKRSGRYRFVSPEGRYIESAKWKTAFFHLVGGVHSHVWTSQRRILPLHSAAMAYAGKGVLFPGPGGSGKTTLALELATCGFDYLSDEYAPIDLDDLRVLPFPRPLQASVEAVEVLLVREKEKILSETPFPDDNGKPRHIIKPSSITSVGQACPVDYLVFPLPAASKRELTALSKAEALAELAQLAIVFHGDLAWQRRAIESLIRLVRQADCYRLALGPIGSNGALIRDLVTGARNGGHSDKSNSDDLIALNQVSERVQQLLSHKGGET